MVKSKILSEKEVLELVKSYPGQKVKVAIVDIDGILRGKVIHVEKFLKAVDSGFGFCDVVFGWDSGDQLYDNADYTGWHSGFPDAQARIDLSTFRQVPWDNDIPFFLADFSDDKGNDLEISPRSLLKKVVAKSDSLGYCAKFAQEFEWFNFEEDSNSLQDEGFHEPEPITRGMFGYSLLRASQKSPYFNDLFDLLKKYSVPLEGLHTETGPGVYEAAILYDNILESADRACLFKAGVKEIGALHGIMPSFMAKWNEAYPGCSGHIHQSLWDTKSDKSLFYDKKDKNGMSDLMQSYLAGLLHCLPEILPMYAPTINSYKRLVEGAWAPTTLTWGVDNRTVALRVIGGGKNSTRVEFRVAGSDVNPYLAMAACLASGLYGIENNLSLSVPQTVGNGYEEKDKGKLAGNLYEATCQMQDSKIANDILGENFVKHFTQTRHWEWRESSKAVTDWELKRYFEII